MSVKETTNRLGNAVANIGNRYAPTLITIIILACFFFYYFSVVLKSNESELKERKFRGLHQVAKNIKTKLETYKDKNARYFLSRMKQIKSKDKRDSTAIEKEFSLKFKVDKTLTKTVPQEKFKYDPTENVFAFYKGGPYYATADLKTFLQPLFREDIFSNYLLACNGSIIYDQLNITQTVLNDYISTTIQDDTIAKIPITESGNLVKTNVGGKNYQLFTIGFTANGNNNFTVGGYISEDEYESERKYIPPYGILWMVIGVVLVIVMIPILRIFLMHKSEPLVTMAVSSTFATVHLLASMVVLAVLNTYVYFHVVQSKEEEKLVLLGNEIDRTLSEEIQESIKVMRSATEELKPTDTLHDIIITKNAAKEVDTTGKINPIKNSKLFDNIRPLLNHVLWTDSTGKQRIRWTTDSTVPFKANIQERDYFRAVADKKLFYDSAGLAYFFTDISSWTSNKIYAVISMPLDSSINLDTNIPRFLMVSGGIRLKSVFDAILPIGYGFCVVDKNGLVLFHNEEIRNLNENIVKECSNSYDIQSVLKHRMPDFFDAKYDGSNYRFYYKPINGTPYSLITFRDMQKGWAEDLDIITATSILVLFNLGIILMAILVIRILSYTNSKTRIRSLTLAWLRPVRTLRREYLSITSYFVLSMIAQILFIYSFRDLDNLTLLLSTFIYTYLMLVTTFHQFSMQKDTQDAVFINPKRILNVLISIPVICIVAYAFSNENGAWWLAIEAFFYWIFYRIITSQWTRITPIARNFLEKTGSTRFKPGFRYSYTWFVWALITSTSVVPLLIIYELCHDEQYKMSIKYSQWDFANKLSTSSLKPFENFDQPLRTSYKQPFHYRIIAKDITGYKEDTNIQTSRDRFAGFYRTIKPSFLNHNVNLELVNSNSTNNSIFNWKTNSKSPGSTLYFKESSKANNIAGYSGWKLSEPSRDMVDTHLFNLLEFPTLPLLLVLLAGIYALLAILIKKIFFEGSIEPPYAMSLDLLIDQPGGVNGNLFIYGPPGTQKIEAVQSEIKKQASFVDIDLGDLANKSVEVMIWETESRLSELPEDTSIVFTNINAYADDPQITGSKLALIEHFQRLKRRMIMISSKYFETLGMSVYDPGKETQINYTSRWQSLMKSFYNVYHRWEKKQPDGLPDRIDEYCKEFLSKCYHILGRQAPSEAPASANLVLAFQDETHTHIFLEIQKLISMIIDECSHSAFLSELTESMIVYASTLASPSAKNIENEPSWPEKRIISRHLIFVFEKVCERIESLAVNHYSSVWNSITFDEQRTLYNIAIDELVNPLNRKTAARLCEIGLINPIDGIACYNIMNISFKKFILNHVANNEISIFKKEIASKGFGFSIQLPLVIVAISAFAFIVITQREVFTNVISYLGAAFAGITGLVKIISSIPASKTETKA